MKLAVKSSELDQARKELADVIQHDRVSTRELHGYLVYLLKCNLPSEYFGQYTLASGE